MSVAKQTSDDVTLTFGATTVVLQAMPLRVDIIREKDVVMSINSRNLLKFEHTRSKDDKLVFGSYIYLIITSINNFIEVQYK